MHYSGGFSWTQPCLRQRDDLRRRLLAPLLYDSVIQPRAGGWTRSLAAHLLPEAMAQVTVTAAGSNGAPYPRRRPRSGGRGSGSLFPPLPRQPGPDEGVAVRAEPPPAARGSTARPGPSRDPGAASPWPGTPPAPRPGPARPRLDSPAVRQHLFPRPRCSPPPPPTPTAFGGSDLSSPARSTPRHWPAPPPPLLPIGQRRRRRRRGTVELYRAVGWGALPRWRRAAGRARRGLPALERACRPAQ